MFSLKIYRNGFKKSEFNDLDISTALALVKELHLNNKSNMPSYYITEEGSTEVLFSNTDFKEIDDIKTTGGIKMKSKILNRLMAEFNEYESKKVDEKALRESMAGKYAETYINEKVLEARNNNNNLRLELMNKVSFLKDETLKELRNKLADEMLNSRVSDVAKMLNTPGITYSNEELQALYSRFIEQKDAPAVRYINEYALKNNRTVTGERLYSIEDKIEAVNKACDYTTNYIGKPLEMALVQEQLFPKFDSILE